MAQRKDPLAAKQAKQKKLAIGGGVLLLALLAFQVPRTMKMLHGQGNVTTSASTAPASTTPAGATPLAPPSLDGSSASSAVAGTDGSAGAGGAETSSDGVVDPSNPLPASSGQLISFNRFKTKDPFVQQVQDCPTGACSGSSASAGPDSGSGSASGSGSGSGATSASGTNGTSPVAAGSGSGSGSSSGGLRAAQATTASISVNGAVSKVTAGQNFPAGDPVFVLVSLTAKAAKISIAGGSLATGAPTVTLKLGQTLRLQNTTNGTLYALRLVATA